MKRWVTAEEATERNHQWNNPVVLRKPKKVFQNPLCSRSGRYFQLQRCESLYEIKESQGNINNNDFNNVVFKIVPH